MPILASLFIVLYIVGLVLDFRANRAPANAIYWILLAILGIEAFYGKV